MATTGNMSYYLKRKIQDLVQGGQAYTPPTGIFIALFTAQIDFSATGGWPGEVNAGGYSRFSAANDLNKWTTALTASGTGYKFNAADFVFPTAQADWGTATHAAILDAATNGNVLHWFQLSAAKMIGSGDVFRFPSGAIGITLT